MTSLIHGPRGRRRNRALLAIMIAALLLAVPAVANATGSARKPGAQVSVTADPATLDIATGQCAGKPLTVLLTNNGATSLYVDATLSTAGPLVLQRSLISTYLPAGYTSRIPVPLSAPLGTEPGTYKVRIASGRSTATVPVTVTTTAPDPSGNLARSATKIVASSAHASYPVCGPVDGDTDGSHWATGSGWNDANSKIWPDWYELQWDTAQTIGHVTLHTLNSTQYPASRYGLRDWDVQTLSDGRWQTVASVRGNTEGVVTTTFTPVQTTALRIFTIAGNGANDYSRIMELQAFGS